MKLGSKRGGDKARWEAKKKTQQNTALEILSKYEE